jgi:hypothetical protein
MLEHAACRLALLQRMPWGPFGTTRGARDGREEDRPDARERPHYRLAAMDLHVVRVISRTGQVQLPAGLWLRDVRFSIAVL